jgi:hypothetical protein
MLEDVVVQRIFGLKRDERWDYSKIHNTEFSTLYFSHNITKVTKTTSAVAGVAVPSIAVFAYVFYIAGDMQVACPSCVTDV